MNRREKGEEKGKKKLTNTTRKQQTAGNCWDTIVTLCRTPFFSGMFFEEDEEKKEHQPQHWIWGSFSVLSLTHTNNQFFA